MEIKYFIQNLKLTDQEKEVINKKLNKLSYVSHKIWEAKVDLSYDPVRGKKHSHEQDYRMEVNLKMEHKFLRATNRAKSILSAADSVEHKLLDQLRRYKTEKEAKKRKIIRSVRKRKGV